MSFKTKNRKKKCTDTRVTIDAKHNEQVKLFKEKKKLLPVKKKELSKLENELEKIIRKDLKEFTDEEFNIKDELEDKIDFVKKEIYNLENSVEEKEYYLQTSNLLFDYYDNSKSSVVKKKKNNKGNKTVMDWLNKDQDKLENNRQKICDSYLSITNPEFVRQINNSDDEMTCLKCNIEKTTHLSDGCMICKKCGDVSYIVIDSDKPSYKDPPKEI